MILRGIEVAKSYFEIPDWTTSEGSNPFDETLARTRLLQQAGMAPTIINLDWTPRLRAYQQRDGWQDQPVLGLYDDLQLATDVQERVLSIRDLNWPSDVLFFTTDGGLFVYQGATRIAEAFMNPMMTDRLDVVRYFADGQVVAENRYDYRGFLSQRIEYENGQPTTRRFYSPGGRLRGFYIFTEQQQASLSLTEPFYGRDVFYDETDLQAHYLQHLLTDVVGESAVIVNATNAKLAVVARVTTSLAHVTLNVSSRDNLTPDMDQLQALQARGSQVVTTTAHQKAQLVKQLSAETVQQIVAWPTRPDSFGTSSQYREEIVAWYVPNFEGSYERQVTFEKLMQLMVAYPMMAVWIVGDGPAMDFYLQWAQETLGDEFYFPKEYSTYKQQKNDEVKPRVALKIATDAQTTYRALLPARMILDLGDQPDDFVGSTALTLGVPYFTKVPSDFMVVGDNGALVTTVDELDTGLSQYLYRLNEWTQARTFAESFAKRFDSAHLVSAWQQVLSAQGGR